MLAEVASLRSRGRIARPSSSWGARDPRRLADIYRQQNFGNRIGLGRRSALLTVDFTVGFNDPALFGGGNIDTAVQRTAGLLESSAPSSRPGWWGRTPTPWWLPAAPLSGCVRASVIDSISHNFRTIVARDCVGDRAIGPHEANLFDMPQKYADVLERDEILRALAADR